MIVAVHRALLRLFGHRWYYSTSCLHDVHKHCRSAISIDDEPKKPGTCKWCPAVCVCRCHRPTNPGRRRV